MERKKKRKNWWAQKELKKMFEEMKERNTIESVTTERSNEKLKLATSERAYLSNIYNERAVEIMVRFFLFFLGGHHVYFPARSSFSSEAFFP